MRVLFVATECTPFIKTGGLADVVGALPKALSALGLQVRIILPLYPAVSEYLCETAVAAELGPVHGARTRLVQAKSMGLDLILVDAPHLYDRPGTPYIGPDGKDWNDNHLRFGALSKIAADVATKALNGWKPDIVHLHDWQTGPTAAYLRKAGSNAPPAVMTIHNIAFQGIFPSKVVGEIGLPKSYFTPEGFEFFGQLSFLKAGMVFADKITTVSPTYSREIMTKSFGMGLEGVLAARQRDLSGILNGIDLADWNPASDPAIAAQYSIRSVNRKALSKAVVEKRFGLQPNSGAPLFSVISRLTEQKGLDLLLDILPRLVGRGARLAVLGTGDAILEKRFIEAAGKYSRSVGVIIGYEEKLSHLMQAGADAIVIPSRFEPCGLTQLYALRYGTLPVVARTGGLADTVIDANEAALLSGCATGFQFSPINAEALADAIDRACDIYAMPQTWRCMVRRAMQQPVGWERSAAAYAKLYKSMLE